MVRWEEEHDNLRAALRWALESRDAEAGARLVLALWRFWVGHGYQSEGRRWAEAVLALDRAKDRAGEDILALSPGKRAFLLGVAGNLALAQGDYDRSVALYEESLEAYRSLDERKIGMSFALNGLGLVAYEQGDYERAASLQEQALTKLREREHTWGIAFVLTTFADVVRARGDLERASTMLEEGLTLFRRLKHTGGMARALASLGEVARERGEEAQAAKFYEESIELHLALGHYQGVTVCLEGLARVAAGQGRLESAARLSAAAATLREEFTVPLPPVDRVEHERIVTTARAALGEDAFVAAWTEGYALSLEEAITGALDNRE